MNELIFLGSVFTVSSASCIALWLGKEYLIGLVSIMAVLVNLFVVKQITLLGLTATASDALAVGITLSLNLMQEYYSKPAAIKTIWISFFCALFYVTMTIFHLAYGPASSDISSSSYQMILGAMPRTVIASFVTFLIVQFTDAHLYGFLKGYFEDRYFVLRNYGTLGVTQLLDTVLFSFLGLYMINPAFSDLRTIGTIILVSYSIKLLVIALAVPYVRFVKTFYPAVPS